MKPQAIFYNRWYAKEKNIEENRAVCSEAILHID